MNGNGKLVWMKIVIFMNSDYWCNFILCILKYDYKIILIKIFIVL